MAARGFVEASGHGVHQRMMLAQSGHHDVVGIPEIALGPVEVAQGETRLPAIDECVGDLRVAGAKVLGAYLDDMIEMLERRLGLVELDQGETKVGLGRRHEGVIRAEG